MTSTNVHTAVYYPITLTTNVQAYVDASVQSHDRDGGARDDGGAIDICTKRRFSEFAALHAELSRSETYGARLPPMPKKALFHSKSVADTRQRDFQYVLDAIARDYELRESAVVVKFFTEPDTTKSDGVVAMTDGSGKPATVFIDDDAYGEDDNSVLPPRDNRGLENLLASTMRVHGGARDEPEVRHAVENHQLTPETTNAFDEEELKPTQVVEPAMPFHSSTTSMDNDNDNDTHVKRFECSGRGAREAIKANDAQALETLLDRGVDVNFADSTQNTLLHLAGLFNRKGAVEILLSRGADRAARNRAGETAIDVAPVALGMLMKRFVVQNPL